MIFRIDGREYTGASALAIIGAMRREAARGRHERETPREFICRAHAELRDRVHPRELDVSDRLSDEALALNYLCLCDEYGVGELSDAPPGAGLARPEPCSSRKAHTTAGKEVDAESGQSFVSVITHEER